ncbi:MAG: hypothetical protein P9C36_06250 [Defluviicoccus sp.]|nr:hypothetical protein [Defluviicoccus sp.]MDS4012425.1 hypothetical protein [Defluviicoccus sp.]
MITECFPGTGQITALMMAKCKCSCWGGPNAENFREGSSSELPEAEGACKCNCWCERGKASTQRNDDTSAATAEAS